MHSLAFPFHQVTDLSLFLAARAAEQQAFLYEHEPYPAGSLETDAGCVAERQNGVRWGKRSLMSQAREGRGGGRVWEIPCLLPQMGQAAKKKKKKPNL